MISLAAGDAGVSGISGNSISSSASSPVGGGAPRAAEGGELLTALGRGVSTGRTRLDEILGGLSGRGAAAGVLGVEARKVLTMTSPEVPEAPEAEKLVTVAMACGVWFSGISLEAKFYRQEMSSISISSSSPSLLALTFLKKGTWSGSQKKSHYCRRNLRLREGPKAAPLEEE